MKVEIEQPEEFMTTLGRRSFLAGSLALAGAAALPATRPARAAVADLDFASALDVAWAIRAGQISSVELTSRMLERIAWQAYFRTHDVFLMPTALVARVPARPIRQPAHPCADYAGRPAPLQRPLLLDLVRHARRLARNHRAGRHHRGQPPGGPPDRGAISRGRHADRGGRHGWPT